MIGTYTLQTAAEVERTLAGCATAYAAWRDTAMAERVACYRRLAGTLRQRADALAALITAEMGGTLTLARSEIEKCAATLDWLAEHGPAALADEPAPVEGDLVCVSFLPIGTVLGVMPWNLPMLQCIRAARPILLSGNRFLLKHATSVMGCAFAMREAHEASGFPVGLFGTLNTDVDAVARVIEDPRIAAVTVTGSVLAGSAVAATAARVIKKSVLELGRSDAFIVLADADLDAAVQAAVQSRYENAGQVCIAAKRIILERPIAEAFTRRFVDAVGALKVGDPMDQATFVGPIARGDLRDGIHDQVERSVARGARLLLGGRKMEGPGYFYEPTVLAEVQPGVAAFDEEIFGPVAALTVAEDLEDAIRLANSSEYGLSGNIWAANVDTARRAARRLETGGVFINGYSASNARAPVGGLKRSGYGRELSHFGLREFTNAQTVWVHQGVQDGRGSAGLAERRRWAAREQVSGTCSPVSRPRQLRQIHAAFGHGPGTERATDASTRLDASGDHPPPGSQGAGRSPFHSFGRSAALKSILVTGATGKTGRHVVALLTSAGRAVRIATRSPGADHTVAFDWNDPATYGPALEDASAVYLIAPSRSLDMLSAMKPFLDLAMREPTRRLVLLSALATPRGGPLMGAVHDYLAGNAVRWIVLRPSWFMQNFSETLHLRSIREHGVIRTAAGDGRTGFVDAKDIAAVAAAALTGDGPNGEKIPTGPAALTYGDAAALLSKAIGRTIRHDSVGVSGLAADFEAHGMSRDYARTLAELNAGIARGGEDMVTSDVLDAKGEPPASLASFADHAKPAWT